jgi:hypothetical protein
MATAATAKRKPRRELLKRQLLSLLMEDRAAAKRERNPSAQLAATVKLAEIALRELAEAEARQPPLATLTTILLHQVICPVCREKTPVSEFAPSPPPPSQEEAERLRRAQAWAQADVDPDPAPPASIPDEAEAVLKVPKLPHQMRRKRRDPIVRGLC